jgi:hypothetical protein
LRKPIVTAVSTLALLAASCGDAHVEETEPLISSARAPLVVSNLWQESDFPLRVCFRSNGDGTTAHRQAVRDAVMGSWAAVSDVVGFTGWDTCADNQDGDIRIFLDSSVKRSTSPVGTDSRRAAMNLRTPLSQYNSNLTYAYIHEFGHALGIQHEQSHPDKATEDSGCTDTEALVGTVVGPYDANSIMNYCAPTLSALDESDVVNIHRMYPFFRVHSPVLIGARQRVCALFDGDGPDVSSTTEFFSGQTSVTAVGAEVDTSRAPHDTHFVACESRDGIAGGDDVVSVSLAAILAAL